MDVWCVSQSKKRQSKIPGKCTGAEYDTNKPSWVYTLEDRNGNILENIEEQRMILQWIRLEVDGIEQTSKSLSDLY